MDIEEARRIAWRFTSMEDYDDLPEKMRWTTDAAIVNDPDGERRIYATDGRAAVQLTVECNPWGDSVPDGFRLNQVRAFFDNWPTEENADFEAFNLYHANLTSAVRAAWRDWTGDPLAMDDLTIYPYAFTMMRVAMPDKLRTPFAVNYMHTLLTAMPDWTVIRAYIPRNPKSPNDSFMRVEIGDARAAIMPLRVPCYIETGMSLADAATGTLIHSHDDAWMVWPPKTEEDKQCK